MSSTLSEQLNKLDQFIEQLSNRAVAVDQHFEHNKWHQKAMQQQVFYQDMFHCCADKFLPYCLEIKQELQQLEQLIKVQQLELANAVLEKINQQIAALNTTLNAVELLQNDIKTQQAQKQRSYQKKQQNKTKTIVYQNSTQQLYQQLAQHHDYERRLAAMIVEQQTITEQATTANQAQAVQKQLALQQRLGRCRRAITEIERAIERTEKRL